MNPKIKQFQAKIAELVSRQMVKITEYTAGHLADFNNIELIVFSNESPYLGEVKNKVFFTYHDHYRGNSSTTMACQQLNQPHLSMDDRGYIKGVATDLNGYLKLKSATYLSHNLAAGVYFPKFRRSIHSDKYIADCENIVSAASAELNLLVESKKEILNIELRMLTGCSLLYYIRDI